MAMLLAALLLFLLAGPSAAQTDAAVSCDSEAELLGSLTWVRDACSQAGEQFDDDDTLVPGAVTTRGCAEVVRRVASDCGGLLARSPWFASRTAALDAADAAASALTADGGGVGTDAALHLADPGLRFVHSCGAVLDDGFAQFPSIGTGQSRVAIDVGPSRGTLRLDFETLTLDAKANDNLRLYADADENEELRQIFPGDLPLTEPIEVPGSEAYLLLVSDGVNRRTGFRATVRCVCEDDASFADADGDGCDAYAPASAKHGLCANRMARSACSLACGACTPDPCDAAPCQNGGTCAPSNLDGGAGHRRQQAAECTAAELPVRSTAVTAACCDDATDCSSGALATCNAGCAAVLIPPGLPGSFEGRCTRNNAECGAAVRHRAADLSVQLRGRLGRRPLRYAGLAQRSYHELEWERLHALPAARHGLHP
jgi:hypothetical protein